MTRLGLGSAPLGGLFEEVADDEAHRVVETAWQAGIRFFDTAPLYGHGLAEQRLGAVLRTKPRDEFVLATKVGRLLRAGAPPEPGQAYKGVPAVNPVYDFSYDGVMRSVEESLERLGLDRVDVLHIHDPDDHVDQALTGAYRALDRLRTEGTIKAVNQNLCFGGVQSVYTHQSQETGCAMRFGVFLPPQAKSARVPVRFAREADFDCFLLAGRYTLLDRAGAKELLPLCAERRISIVAGGVFNSGILANPRPGATFNYEAAPTALVRRAVRMQAICERHGVDLKAAAIQFPLRHPAVASVLTGCRSVGEVEENVHMFQAPIPSALWDELDA